MQAIYCQLRASTSELAVGFFGARLLSILLSIVCLHVVPPPSDLPCPVMSVPCPVTNRSAQIAKVWYAEMVEAAKTRKLFFLWLANDVLQRNRYACMVYTHQPFRTLHLHLPRPHDLPFFLREVGREGRRRRKKGKRKKKEEGRGRKGGCCCESDTLGTGRTVNVAHTAMLDQCSIC